MSAATNTPTTAAPTAAPALPFTSRRGLFAGSGVGALLAGIGLSAVAAQPAKSQSDAELLDACCAFSYGCAALARINAMDRPTDEMIAPVVDAWAAPINTIITTPATTLAGARAKAQAVIGFFESGGVDRDKGQPVEEAASKHELMAWRLCHEILAMGSTPA